MPYINLSVEILDKCNIYVMRGVSPVKTDLRVAEQILSLFS